MFDGCSARSVFLCMKCFFNKIHATIAYMSKKILCHIENTEIVNGVSACMRETTWKKLLNTIPTGENNNPLDIKSEKNEINRVSNIVLHVTQTNPMIAKYAINRTIPSKILLASK